LADKPLQDLLSRLERERLEADRRYNDALTALDAAARVLAAAPPESPPLVPYDPSQLPRVNERWQILSGAYDPRLAHERQQEFNASLVDHLNRNVGAHAEAGEAIAALRAAMDADRAARASFDSALIQFLQRITEYVDTKDRALGGPELKEQIVLANERTLALKRELADRPQATGHGPRAADADTPATGYRLPPSAMRASGGGPAADFSYVGFEDRFRGSQESIRARLEDYVPLFAAGGGGDVLDVGCGRGELLALLSEAGVPARGIDVNGEMVALCRERGFNAEQADALAYLESLPDASLAGLSAIQVVEHLEPGYLARFLETAFHKLRPGAPIVLETINPACWMAFFEAYIRDLTHAQPLHPDTLKFLVQASGFSSVDVQLRSPVTDADRLERVEDAALADGPAALRAAAAAINANADKLNARLFSSMDYAVTGRR
jgi:SAM-dependent methyltransferase